MTPEAWLPVALILGYLLGSIPFGLILTKLAGTRDLRAIGLETMLPASLRLIHNGEMDFKTLIRAMSTRPAELLGLPGGSLRAGSPADLVVIDPDTPWVLDPADLKSQCKNTPFDEARFSGRVVRTIVGGRTVYEHV